MVDITDEEQPWAAGAEQIFEVLQLQAALNQTSLNGDLITVGKNVPGYFPECEGKPERQARAQAAFAACRRQGRMEALAKAKVEMERYRSMNTDGMKDKQKAGLMELRTRLEEYADRLAMELDL